MKVLVVDDDKSILELSKTYLEKIYGSLTVTTVNSADKALDMLQEYYFSAVVSDYQMPGMNGLKFLKEVRKRGNNITFIIFTGKGREEVAMKALNLGADRYIQKGDDLKSEYVVLAQAIKQSVERKNALRQLKRSEKEKTAILNSLSEVVVHQDQEGRIIWANQAFSEVVEKKLDTLTGHYCYKVWFDRDSRCKGCPIIGAYELGERKEAIIQSEENGIWYIRGEPVKDKNNEIVGMLEIAEDITKKRETKQRLKHIEKRFSSLVESSTSAVFIIKDNKITYHNRSTELITGHSKEELNGMNFTDLIAKEQKEVFQERIEAVKNTEIEITRFELKVIGKDGGERWLYLTMSHLGYEQEDSVMCNGVEITDQKYLEEALVRSAIP